MNSHFTLYECDLVWNVIFTFLGTRCFLRLKMAVMYIEIHHFTVTCTDMVTDCVLRIGRKRRVIYCYRGGVCYLGKKVKIWSIYFGGMHFFNLYTELGAGGGIFQS